MSATATRPPLLGTNEIRVDGRAKVSGRAQYTADVTRDGMLWAAFVTSPHAHARIVRIETSAARVMPGVRAVLTGADIGERYSGCLLRDWPVLALERVKFAGEYVAVVAADTAAAAESAAVAIDVVYEELPPLLDPEAALADGAPLLHPHEERYPCGGPPRAPRPHPNMQGHVVLTKGDPEAGFRAAERVFERTFRTPRYHPGYLEPRAVVLWIDPHDVLHVVCSTNRPFAMRDRFAEATGHPVERIVVEASFPGGDFGAKGLPVEGFPLYFLARATGRPIKYVRTHLDDVRSSASRHASVVRAKIGTRADGTITAVDLTVLFDGGAYAAAKPVPGLMPGRTPKLPYAIEHARVERVTVYTNAIPGTYVRAPGDLQITFAFESLLDVIARELGIDPIEVRLRNAAGPADTDLDGNPLAEPRPREVLGALRDALRWDTPPPAGRGRGVALTALHAAMDGWTNLRVTTQPDGALLVETGSTEYGVGTFTVIQRVLAAELGLDPARIAVVQGATDAAPWDFGMGGSRGTLLLGRAALDAARKLREALAQPHAGAVTVEGEGKFLSQPGDPVWQNFGAYGFEVSVDAETGALTVHDAVFVADVGTILNPVGHRGQIDGSFLMGLGSALSEELHYDEDGRLLNPALSDYKLPCQRDMPPFRVVELPPGDGAGPFGARAAGEFATHGVAPALANAVAAACGARIDRLPLTAERIYDALGHR
jgi:carbon-monoxide dehydrogenase large subunit